MNKYKCYFKEQAEDKAVKELDLTESEWECLKCKSSGEESRCFEYIPLYLTRFYQDEVQRKLNPEGSRCSR